MDEAPLLPLSPSRAADFKSCPQLFKFRAVDRLPEPPEPSMARGTLVHVVLEGLLRLPPRQRTRDRALAMLAEGWEALREAGEAPELDAGERRAWMAGAERLLLNYFRLEDPGQVEVHRLEWWVEHAGSGSLLRGIIDRVEVLPGGGWRLTDYKTGPSPSEAWSLGAFFALRFYALVCWRAHGEMPAELRLLHLAEPVTLTLRPTRATLEGLERQLEALGLAIARAHRTGDWRPRRGAPCSWCPHRGICPAWEEAPRPASASAGV